MRIQLFLLLILIVMYGCGGGSTTPDPVSPAPGVSTNQAFTAVLDQHDVPAIAGAYIERGQIIEQFALGKRLAQGAETVVITDRWHLGSVTKSVTATLAAILIEQGQLNWDTTIADVFDRSEYDAKYTNVTLEQLLSHTAGIEADILRVDGWDNYFTSQLPIRQQRTQLSISLLALPGNRIGSFSYSNGGYVIAGHMLERIMDQTWEDLLEEYLFIPLGIQDVQFGAPTDGFMNSQPYGHRLQNNSWLAVSPDDPYSDNPAAMGPAGTLSMSLASLAVYTIEHLSGRNGESSLLTQTSFVRLHQPVAGTDYAMGWFTKGTNVYHMGTNTMWYAHVGMDFGNKDIAVIALTNVGSERGTAVTDNMIDVLLDRNY